jgi:hypothetical protein
MDMVHYHIRWNRIALNWERFKTRAKAAEAANILRIPGETYAIEEFDELCAKCRAIITMRSGRKR